MTVLAVSATPLVAPPLPEGRPNLVLAGFMGTGKTTVGRAAAAELALPFLDTDDAITTARGRSISAIFAEESETGLRRYEAAAVADAAHLSATVVATGGGAPLDRDGFAALARSGVTVVLRAGATELARRLGASWERPLLMSGGEHRVAELLQARSPVYEALGGRLETEGRRLGAIVDEAVARYRSSARAGPLRLEIACGGEAPTRVIVGDGAISESASALRDALPGARRAAVVADGAVIASHAADVIEVLRAAGIEPVGPFGLPPGEAAKHVDVLATLWDRFHEAGLDPSAAVVAVGGGAALDVAGFAAATYARGIRLVNVPTTVLAMADAAVGGKVAIDHAGAKNLVGVFHPAVLVIADTSTCATLPPAVRRQGLAEIVKCLVLIAPTALEVAADASLAWGIEQALRAKAAFVSADPRDRGIRRALNLGHTFAHAIESASSHTVAHGDAVAIGLVAAARLGARLGMCDAALADRVATVLEHLGLPTAAPALDPSLLRRALAADKKRAGGAVRFIVPAPGGAALVSGVDADAALGSLRP